MKKVTDTNTLFSKYLKPIAQRFIFNSGESKKILIMGSQRSGTTLLSRTFDSFFSVKSFGEFSSLSNECPLKIRLNSIDKVNRELNSVHAPLIVLKPLVESQNSRFLLERIPNSYCLWMYRHYLDVASSGVKHFKQTKGKGNLYPIIDNEKDNWRNDNLPNDLRSKILDVYSDKLNSYECACLFWYVRNSLFFSQNLNELENVFLWNYESLMDRPRHHFNVLGGQLKFDFSNFDYEAIYSKKSVKKKHNFQINDKILELCETMWRKLESSSGRK